MIDIELYKKAMEVGCLFDEKYFYDYRTLEWIVSEQCSYFCKRVIKKADKHKCSIEESIEKWTRILISAGRTLKQDISMKLVENHPRKT